MAAVATGGALNGCGGALVGHLGDAGASGSSAAAGRAGTSGSGRGGMAAGGTGGTAGTAFGEPPCLSTVTKGGACSDVDQQFCYKTCGPQKSGVKSETCMAGVYIEMSGCTFDPSKDYSCYGIPTAANAACPAAEPPVAGTPCFVSECTVCNTLQGVAGGQYLDSAGAPKIGFCVCQPPDATGTRAWSCASDTAWPCPLGAGCNGTGGIAGTAGTSSRGGAGGRGPTGTGGVGGTGGGGSGEPACLSTVAKGVACTAADQQFCYKTCGPEKSGVKSETCTTAGTYAEMSGCSFDPSRDYSCYSIPPTANATCPLVVPQASASCTVDHCVLCNASAGLPGGYYLDASGAAKVGYCTCQLPNSAGLRTWSCASDVDWPCPLGAGCGGPAGRGGSSGGAGGRGGSGGSVGPTGGGGSAAGGASGDFGQPSCLGTVTKGGACSPADQQLCYKTCGPQATGVKAETCTTAGTYAEMSGCAFDPGRDYSCYKLPVAANAACPAGVTPQGSQPCDAAACTACNSLQGLIGGQYLDSTGVAHPGYCVCQPPNSSGIRTWSCASDTSWPCPLGGGC